MCVCVCVCVFVDWELTVSSFVRSFMDSLTTGVHDLLARFSQSVVCYFVDRPIDGWNQSME